MLQLERQIADSLARVPGVSSVGLTSAVTMDGNDSNDPVFVEEFPTPAGQMPPIRRYKWVGPGYVETMGNHMVAGRALTWEDSAELRDVVMISERLAREFWKDPRQAIGKRIRQSEKNPWKEIVGVVGDERDDGVHRPATTIVYWPLQVKNFWTSERRMERSVAYVVRSPRTNSPTCMKELQQAVWSANSNLPLANTRTLEQIRASSMAQTSFALAMLAHRRGRRAAARPRRHLRRDRLHRRAAHARNRHPHGARRADRRREPPVRAARPVADGRRRGARRAGRGRVDAVDVVAAVRRQPDGPGRRTRRCRSRSARWRSWRRICRRGARRGSIQSWRCAASESVKPPHPNRYNRSRVGPRLRLRHPAGHRASPVADAAGAVGDDAVVASAAVRALGGAARADRATSCRPASSSISSTDAPGSPSSPSS